MSELRQDAVGGKWVIIAPERGKRPRDWKERAPAPQAPAYDPACPFCPGNEALLSAIVEEMPADAPPGWRTRVVPNKFAALAPDAPRGPRSRGLHRVAGGFGRHEVIVETPRHDADIAKLSNDERIAALASYRRRCWELFELPGIRSVVAFRNHGASAGASLRHPHAQVMALGMVPPRVREREARARRHYRGTGRCVLCEFLAHEREDGRRVVADSGAFTALVPFAATGPFELWLVPGAHQASFADIDESALPDLAAALGDALGRLGVALGGPAYNLVIEQASSDGIGSLHLHWYLRIVPDLVTPGGFELGSGLCINPSLPEDDAAALRAAGAKTAGT